MNKTEQYNYLRTVLLKQQAPFTQKDTGRNRVHALQMWCSILEPIWNPKNKRLSVIFAKPLILWCPHTDSNRGPTDYKSVALPAEL